jgi:hypothetical protein
MTERDTHFLGSVRQLSSKLEAYVGTDADMIAIEALIAQYAYDVGEHVYNHTTEAMTVFNSFEIIAETNEIPDLDVWPPTTAE